LNGLGKTSICLEGFRQLRAAGEVARALVVAPLRVCQLVWPAEAEKWDTGLRVHVMHGTKGRHIDADADIYVINTEGLAWLVGDKSRPGPWLTWRDRPDMLVVDESTRFRHPTSQRFRALRRILGHFRRRYILTGTPAPRCLSDLWGQMFLLDQGETLGRTLGDFRQRFMVPVPRDRYFDWVLRRGAEQDIYKAIAPLVLRIDASDVLDLPEVVTTQIRVELPRDARRAYDDMKSEMVATLQSGELAAANAGVATSKCRQIANGAVYMDDVAQTIHSAKADALGDLVDELAGRPLLVAYEYKHDLAAIRRALGDVPALGGGMSIAEAHQVTSAWNRGQLPVLAVHPKSAGHGLNLQAGGCHLAWFSLTWDLEDYDQLVARLHRQGQKAVRVMVYQIMARDTVDETVVKTLQRKSRTQTALLDALREDLGVTEPEVVPPWWEEIT
jgi:SNF2 family DNA or RNA helicase